MPVVAVAGALVAGAVAAVDIAAVGIAAIGAIQVFEVVAAVGATLGAIGTITKDKTLSMVGLGLGAIGGVGALATSAGLFGAEAAGGSSIFGSGPQAASATQEAGGTFGGDFIPQISAPGSAAASGGVETGAWDVANMASDGAMNWAAGAAPPTGVSETPPTDLTTLSTTSESTTDPAMKLAMSGKDDAALLNSGQAELDKTLAGTGSKFDPLQGGAPPAPPGDLGATDPITGQVTTTSIDPATGKILSMPDGGKGIFGDILDFARKNPTVAMGVLKTGGSLIEGGTNQLTPAQIEYYNAKANEAQATAAMANQQRQTLAMPKAVASIGPVTGAPQQLVPQTPGFLNQAPRLAPVTGAVA